MVKVGNKYTVPAIIGFNFLDGDFQKKNGFGLGDFSVKKVGSKRDPSPKGTILSQTPKSGDLVPKPIAIKVIISGGL